jgi:5,10-methylenetetrahydrofolate reductase
MAVSNTVRVSFEFFPPNDDAMAEHLWTFVSVTYGADGSTRSRTHACMPRMLRETGHMVTRRRSKFRSPPIRKGIRNP